MCLLCLFTEALLCRVTGVSRLELIHSRVLSQSADAPNNGSSVSHGVTLRYLVFFPPLGSTNKEDIFTGFMGKQGFQLYGYMGVLCGIMR